MNVFTNLIEAIRARLAAGRARRDLDRYRSRAAEAAPSFKPQYYLRAAGAARILGRESETLELYGHAIDGYLEAGRGRAAEALCRRLIEQYPHVVRARRTLALMAIGRGESDEATHRIGDYVEVARESGDAELLKHSLRLIGSITRPGAVRETVVSELERLGDRAAAERLASGDPAPAAFDGEAGVSWSRALQAALVGAEDLANPGRRDPPG